MLSTPMRTPDDNPSEMAWKARAQAAEANVDACQRCVAMLAAETRAQRARANTLAERLTIVGRIARHALAHPDGEAALRALADIAATAELSPTVVVPLAVQRCDAHQAGAGA